jgi:hypothetical protein
LCNHHLEFVGNKFPELPLNEGFKGKFSCTAFAAGASKRDDYVVAVDIDKVYVTAILAK